MTNKCNHENLKLITTLKHEYYNSDHVITSKGYKETAVLQCKNCSKIIKVKAN